MLNLDNLPVRDKRANKEKVLGSPLFPSPISSSSSNVIKRVIMTRTEITTYPNGQTYYKSQTWEPDKPTVIKKKVKRTSKVSEVIKKDTESY